MSNDRRHGIYIKIFNSQSLNFIPSEFWKQRDISLSDFKIILRDSDSQIPTLFQTNGKILKFNQKLWCMLQITSSDKKLYREFGVQWQSNTNLTIEIIPSIVSSIFGNISQTEVQLLFESNGWKVISQNEPDKIFFTINSSFCLNNEFFDTEFYTNLIKISKDEQIIFLGHLFSSELCSFIQSDAIEKSINYTSKYSETLTLDESISDESILDDVVHFVTFPGQINFDQYSVKKKSPAEIFNKISKDQLLFDESWFDPNHHRMKIYLELPSSEQYQLLPDNECFTKAIAMINTLLILSENLRNSFFDNMFDLIQKVEDDRSFFEIISILFTFIKSYLYEPKSFTPIFMSPLFDDYATIYNYSEDYQKLLYLREKWTNFALGFTENYMLPSQTKISKKSSLYENYKEIFQTLRKHPIGFSEFCLIISHNFAKLQSESQKRIMLLMAQTNVYYYICLKSILSKFYKCDDDLLNKYFYYQQMMNVKQIEKFDLPAQFYENYNLLSIDDKRKVSAIIQARFSILTFFYKNFDDIFKKDENGSFSAYQFKTFKLFLSSFYEISLQNQILSLIGSNCEIQENDLFSQHFTLIYLRFFSKRAKDIISINFCNNLINFLHKKIYKLSQTEKLEGNNWIDFLFKLFPNIIIWYSIIDISLIPTEFIQSSICDTLSFMTSCLCLTKGDLHDSFDVLFDSLFAAIENICLFYFKNSETCRDLLFKSLLNLAAEKELSSIYCYFSIKCGKAIHILVKIFFNESTFAYLNNICFMNLRNCYTLSISGVDTLLIDYLYDNRNNKNEENKALNLSIIRLFKTLSEQHSNEKCVTKFISLLTPINGSFLPYYLPLYINMLADLTKQELKFPTFSIPLLPNECILNVSNIDADFLNNGLTFSFWFFINNTFSEEKPLLIIKQKLEALERRIIISLKPDFKFGITVDDIDDIFKGPTKTRFTEGKWHFIMIQFNFRSNDLQIKFLTDDSSLHTQCANNRINDNINAIIHSSYDNLRNLQLTKSDDSPFSQFFSITKFDKNYPIQVFIGGEDDTNYFSSINTEYEEMPYHVQADKIISDYENDVLLGPIGMFLQEESKGYLHYMFHSAHEIPPKALFYAYPQSRKEDVLTYKLESTVFNSVSYLIKHKSYSTFINELIKNGLATKLIPLFAFNDLRAKSNTIRIESENRAYIFDEADDHYYFDYTNAAIEIFRYMFLYSDDAQNDLLEISGFHIIEHLLKVTIEDAFKVNEMIEKNMKSFSLDFYLYKNFVALLESDTNINTQKQLLDNILFNFELWIQSKDFDLILNHWNMSLIPNFYQDFFNKYSIISLLTILRLYLYYQPKEKSIIIEARKIDINKVKHCRNIFLSIIFTSDRLSQPDFSAIISHATSCPDRQQVEEFIDFLIGFFNAKAKQQLEIDNQIKQLQEKPEGQTKEKFSLIRIFSDISIKSNSSTSLHQNKLSNIDIQDFDLFLQLQLLFTSSQHEIIKKVIILFIKLHKMKLINMISFADHFELICANLPNLEKSKEFLNQLLKYFCPEILSICLVVALHADSDESIFKVIEKMETYPNPESLFVRCSSFLWPVICIFLHPQCFEKMIDVFSKSLPSEWPNIYNTMIVVGDILNKKSQSLISYLLTSISTRLCKDYDDQKADMFFRISFHFLFIRYQKDSIIEVPQITEINDKIISLKNYYKQSSFFIDLDSNGCMNEAALALVVLSMYEKKHSKSYSEFITIICAHQLLLEQKPLDRFKKFNSITKNDSFYYYDSIAMSYNRSLLTNEKPQKVFEKHAEYIQEFPMRFEQFFAPLDINNFIKNFQTNYNNIDSKFKNFINDSFHNISTDVFKRYVNEINSLELSYEKQWNVFWSSNSYEKNSIFHYQIHPDNVHFKRDNSACYSFCPSKLSKNKTFNDHLKESYFRDCGNITKAEAKYKQYKEEEEKERYKRTMNHNLFKYNESDDFTPETKNIIDMVNSKETIIYQADDCERRKQSKNVKVHFYVTKDKMIIGNHIIPFKHIKSIFLRSIHHRQTAIEIFEINGNSYFLNFPSISNSFMIISKIQQVIQAIHSLKTINIQSTCSNRFFFESKNFTKKWIEGEISNFEYLLMLNIYSGRSFNDGTLYPVMPWIIQDYDSEELNLEDESVFRDLSLPIGAVNEKRYNMLLHSFENTPGQIEPFLYSSWLVCPLSLYVWLVRLEPFTTRHTMIQGGKFDVEQRIFHSIKAAYELCTHDNNDFRELIPEFFIQPEFLVNLNRFDLGEIARSGSKTDIKLPAWCRTPFEFVYKHRKALESEYVSRNLNKWIDLIFGCKQRSMDDKNVYRRELYCDIWELDFGKKPENERHICDSLDLLGQIPQPLFDSPHPQRKVILKDDMKKNCEDKWSLKEFTLNIQNDLDFLDLRRERSSIEKLTVMHSIVNRQEEAESELPKYFLYVYAIEFKSIDKDDQNKFNYLTHMLKYEMKPDSIAFLSSSLLFVESIESLTVTSRFVKDVSQFGFVSAVGDSLFLSFNLLSENKAEQKKFDIQNIIGCSFEKVAISKMYLAAVDSASSTLFVFRRESAAESEPLFATCLSEFVDDDAACVALSDRFGLCAFATRERAEMLLVSVGKGEVERVVQIGQGQNEGENIEERATPRKVLITPSWGFIVVLATVTETTSSQNNNNNIIGNSNDSSQNNNNIGNSNDSSQNNNNNNDNSCCNHLQSNESNNNNSSLNSDGGDGACLRLFLFNVNGYFIARSQAFALDASFERQIDAEHRVSSPRVARWASFKSRDGFDFVVLADARSVYAFEAFGVSEAPGEPVATFAREIVGLDIIREAEKAVVTLDDGKVVFISVRK